jgi:hypothetical protein
LSEFETENEHSNQEQRFLIWPKKFEVDVHKKSCYYSNMTVSCPPYCAIWRPPPPDPPFMTYSVLTCWCQYCRVCWERWHQRMHRRSQMPSWLLFVYASKVESEKVTQLFGVDCTDPG